MVVQGGAPIPSLHGSIDMIDGGSCSVATPGFSRRRRRCLREHLDGSFDCPCISCHPCTSVVVLDVLYCCGWRILDPGSLIAHFSPVFFLSFRLHPACLFSVYLPPLVIIPRLLCSPWNLGLEGRNPAHFVIPDLTFGLPRDG